MEKKVNSFRKQYHLVHPLILGVAACVLSSTSASAAGITLSATPVAAAPGSSMDSFDVDLTNLGLSAVTIGGFSFGLSIANANISFTDVNTSTEANYIFSGNSLFGPDLSGPNTGQTISAADVVLTPSTGTTINPGQELGLGHVFFNVSASAAPGMFAVNFASFPNTSISDALGNNLSIDGLSPGQITITGAPEPSSLFLLLWLSAIAVLSKFLSARPTAAK